MKIYLASSLKNYSLNERIDDFLRNEGFECFLPQRDAPESDWHGDIAHSDEAARNIYISNLGAIHAADMVLIVAQRMGTDTAWELGYASGQGKRIYMLIQQEDSIQNMYMIAGSIASRRQYIDNSSPIAFLTSMTRLIELLRVPEPAPNGTSSDKNAGGSNGNQQ